MPTIGYFLPNCWLVNSHRAPKIIAYSYCFWLLYRTWQQDSVSKDTISLSYRTCQNQASINLEDSCVLASFHNAGKCRTNYWSNHHLLVIINYSQLWILWMAQQDILTDSIVAKKKNHHSEISHFLIAPQSIWQLYLLSKYNLIIQRPSERPYYY